MLCAFLAFAQAAHSLSYSTAEGSFARDVALLSEFYAKDHGGRSPVAWSDLDSYLKRPIDDAFPHIHPTKRYAFLAQPLRLLPPYEGELLVVTRRPFREVTFYTTWYGGRGKGLREPGRYIIFRVDNDFFFEAYVDEAYIQQVFKGSESLLPTPDSEPERPQEARAGFWSFIKWASFAVVALALAALLHRRKISEWRAPKGARVGSSH